MKKNIFLLFSFFIFVACTPSKSHLAAPTSGPSVQDQGGSTNVGSGGSGAEAKWKEVALDLKVNLHRIVFSKVDFAVFKRIQTELPQVISKAKIEFKDYPLIIEKEHGEEDNSGNLKPDNSESCDNIIVDKNLAKERDAINFKNKIKIKVNRRRFDCYPTKGDEIRRLVLHEYLGLIGITEMNDGQTDYKITNILLKEIDGLDPIDSGLEKVEIHNCNDFQKIGLDPHEIKIGDQFETWEFPKKRWVLKNDIDCSETKTWNDGKGFAPRVLNGVLDGEGYKVTNLFMAQREDTMQTATTVVSVQDRKITAWQQSSYMTAIFTYVCTRCSIANLQIEKADLASLAILAVQNSGKISNTRVSGKMRKLEITPFTFDVEEDVLGGLVSYNYGTIKNSLVDVELPLPRTPNAFTAMGGLVGNNLGIIDHSIARSKILGEGMVGGLVGQNQGIIQSSSALTEIETSSVIYVGGLVGYNAHAGTIISSSAAGEIFIGKFDKQLSSLGMTDGNILFGGLVGQDEDVITPNDKSSTPSISDSNSKVNICGNLDGMPPLYGHQLVAQTNSLVGNQNTLSAKPDARRGIENSTGSGQISGICVSQHSRD